MKSVGDAQKRLVKEEWIALILMAKQMGLTPDEVRKFIQKREIRKN